MLGMAPCMFSRSLGTRTRRAVEDRRCGAEGTTLQAMLMDRVRCHTVRSWLGAAFLSFWYLSVTVPAASAQSCEFAVLKGGDRVGTVFVDRIVAGNTTRYTMTSLSQLTILFTQVVRTTMASEYINGALAKCYSILHLNDALRDSSTMITHQGRTVGYVHPGKFVRTPCTNTWTTARMYYEEPVGQQAIYVESVLEDCPLERIGDGIYRLSLPGRNKSLYVYRGGVLQEIRVDRTLLNLTFRRV